MYLLHASTFFYCDRLPSESISGFPETRRIATAVGPSDFAPPPLVEVRSPCPLRHGTHVGSGGGKLPADVDDRGWEVLQNVSDVR